MLSFINEQMNILKIPYEFLEWKSKIPDVYWVGEYTTTPTSYEDGSTENTFILTGTGRGTWHELIQQSEIIAAHFSSAGGLRGQTDSGSIAVFFSGSFPVPTGDAELKRIQINLDIKEWKGMK